MLKWILSTFDGPITSKITGIVVGVIVTFFANHGYQMTPQEQVGLAGTITMLIGHGIPVLSAMQGNAVTSTTAANAHPPTGGK